MITAILLAQIAIGVQATPVFTRADPSAGGPARSELRVVAPIAFATGHFAGGRIQLHAMLNGEGVTMPGGHLSTGVWGEGFIDRRHPHTWLHELVASVQDLAPLPAGIRWSLSAGKGFAPFGTEDPMGRPALIYPVNHHWSQILERMIAIAGISAGPLTIEAGAFNGDEPEHWNRWPKFDRFGDSWAARAFIRPGAGVELQVSHARVKSPEHRNGSGLDHTMWNASAAIARATRAGDLYAMAEWSHTDEEGAYQYSSVLAEGQLSFSANRVYLRGERTDRPEEQRLLGDDFRSVRPHNENSNLGTTRWTTVTAGFGRRLPTLAAVHSEAILEAAHAHVTNVTGVVFNPQFFYGTNDLWLLSVGIRVAAGSAVHRMGRYGVAATQPSSHMSGMHHQAHE
jgi:hypothetical protein